MSKHEEYLTGVKLLTLYKQHYLNKYSLPLICQYSCWGYFDGMDIVDIKEAKSKLFEKKSRTGISDAWYQTARRIQNQKGIASEQNIAMFRCMANEDDKIEKEFWEDTTRKAFLTVCFVQLKKKTDKDLFRQKIENNAEESVQVISYYTFDNADIILFFQSNSFAEIALRLKMIDGESEVVYTHPICGVLEKALDKMKTDDDHLPRDMSGNAVVNDVVKELRINIVGNVNEFEGKLRYVLDKANKTYGLVNYNTSTFSYVMGHEGYVFSMKDTTIYSLLALLVPEGVLTHKNKVFGNGLYNMETHIFLEEVSVNSFLAKEPVDSNEVMGCWSRKYIERFSAYMKHAWKIGDESLYSYFQSMIQTLNTLAQFEKFDLSKNIFCLIYPAFKLFIIQLEQVSGTSGCEIESKNRKKIIKTMRDFLDSINSIIYHAIHMDQIFLMIPGCSGTSYSIPTKLSMFYLWYLNSISTILNDSTYQYEFYLTPVIETKPCTYAADFGLPPEDRLICVSVSQRSLYMPRALFVILTHETAHYVGDKIRKREKRLEYVVRTIAYIIGEAIIPYWKVDKNEMPSDFAKYLEVKKEEITRSVLEDMKREVQKTLDDLEIGDQKFHVSKMEEVLWNVCAKILADENRKLEGIIKKLPEDFRKPDLTIEEKIRLIETFNNEMQQYDDRRITFMISRTLDKIISELLVEYKEIFADAAAITIAKFDMDDYEMTFNISEGYHAEEKIISQKDFNRRRAVEQVYFGDTREWGRLKKTSKYIREMQGVQDYWPELGTVYHNMVKYLECCKGDLEIQINKKSSEVEEIRKIVEMFQSKRYTFRHVYEFMDAKAQKYAERVWESLQKDIG